MGGDSKKSAGHWVQAEAEGPVDTESHPTLQIQVGLARFVSLKKMEHIFWGETKLSMWYEKSCT